MFSFYLTGLKKIFSIAKKIFLVVAVYFIVISLFAHFINKDKPKPSYNPIRKNREEIYKVINDPKLNETKEGKSTITAYRILTCSMIGEACSNKPNEADKNFNHSIFGSISNLITVPFMHPPASGIYSVYTALQNNNFIPKTYAAEGVGFSGLKSFSQLWKIFRDLSYMLLVLVLIAIGFMIMFRMKLNPQTVISIESALPRIVIALILITFSFAIAGFLIDLMYVLIAVSISLLSKNTLVHIDVKEYQNNLFSGNGWFLFNKLSNVWGTGQALLSFIPMLVRIPITIIISLIVFILLGRAPIVGPLLSGGIVLNTLQGGGAWTFLYQLVSTVPGLIIAFFIASGIGLTFLLSLLVWLTGLFLFFRIFFILFKAYIEIILLIIFSPILLLFEALPSTNIFNWWLKNLFGNIISFPLVIVLMMVATIIIESTSSSNPLWIPPLLPLIEQGNLAILIGVGIMFLIPDFVKLVKELLGVKGLPVNFGISTFFGGAAAGAGGAITGLSTFGSLSLAAPGLKTVVGRVLPFVLDPSRAVENKEEQEKFAKAPQEAAKARAAGQHGG